MLNLLMAFFAFLFIISFFSLGNQVQAQDVQELAQLKEAKDAFQHAFIAVLEAEQTGVNVDGFLDALRVGAELLTQADLSNRIGDVNEVLSKTSSVLEIAFEVRTEAIRERDLEITTRGVAIYSSIVIFLVAGFSYLIAVLLIWKWFKQYYDKRLLSSKLERKTDET